jgi:hypothetical protein
VVLVPRRRHQALRKLTLLRGDGGNKARSPVRSPGRARRKPSNHRAGNAGISGEPVVDLSACFHFCARSCGCSGHTAFPASSLEGTFGQSPGISAAGMPCHGRQPKMLALVVSSAFWRVSNHEAQTSTSSFETPPARLLRMSGQADLWRRKIGAEGGTFGYPHHIWHNYQACTASAWPWPGNVVSPPNSFDRHD